jgi:hypothetical protein
MSELSASTIARLKQMWTEEHARWQKRDLSAKRFVYCWADGSIWRPGWDLARPLPSQGQALADERRQRFFEVAG